MQPEFSSSKNALSSIEGASGRVPPSDISLHPNSDSASDNEIGERPVREQLKKASIDSVPKDTLVYSTTGIRAGKDSKVEHITSFKPEESPSLAKNNEAYANGYHARAERNQSNDSLVMGGQHETYAVHTGAGKYNTPSQNKAEDFNCSNPKEKSQLQATREVENPGYDESSPGIDVAANASHVLLTTLGSDTLPLFRRDSEDLETGVTLFGPRKKRSRDQLDADIDREQKIVATEEAKAQRRSEEQERETLEIPQATDAERKRCVGSRSPQSEERDSTTFSISNAAEALRSYDAAIASTFADAPTSPNPALSVLALDSFDGRDSLAKPSSTSPVPSSDLALLSSTSDSPLKIEDFSAPVSNKNSLDTSANCARNRNRSEKTSEPREGVRSSASDHSIPLGFGALKGSTVGVLGSSGFGSSLGNSGFGTGFGQVFNAGTKLSTFAAPVGDAKWGDQSGSTNLFGAPAKEEEEENSESEEYGLIDAENNDESYEVICRLQQQDGRFFLELSRLCANVTTVNTGEDDEETVFSSARAGLFSWDGAAWKEGGKGTFKLNIKIPGSENSEHTQGSGRLIMRAHQTFRVLLNTPVFKQMKVGDSKGNEPTSKSLSFSVIEKGKPTPYLIRLNDVIESRTLYHAIRKLQQSL